MQNRKGGKISAPSDQEHRKDERPIIAAGYCSETEAAAPMLETIFDRAKRQCPPNDTHLQRMGILKINRNKKYLKILTNEADNSATSDTGVRCTALRLLSDFGKEKVVVDVLLQALIDIKPLISPSAHLALLKIFQDDFMMCQLLKDRNYAISPNGWSIIAQEARLRLGS